MTKLCPRGKAAAKRKFKVYPSAYANAYASKICAGKIKDPSGVKRKDFKGPKPAAKGAMMTAGSQSAMGRLQKARMMNKGGGADTGTVGEEKSRLGVLKNKVRRTVRKYAIANSKKNKDRLTQKDIEMAGDLIGSTAPYIKKKMGGDAKIKKVIKGLNKASKLHAGQAKSLGTLVNKKSVGGMADYYKDLM